MDWDNYRAFLEVYRSGDLGHAAHGLEMSVPTVRRRLDAVESQIGFPLFERTPRGLSPTPVARRLVHSIAAMGDFAAVAGTLKEGPTQSVTISADAALAYHISDTTWAALRRSHPGLAISVETPRPSSGVHGARADVAISHVRPAVTRAAARCAGSLDVGLFAHSDYLSRVGVPAEAADLQRFSMIGPESEDAKAWLETRLGLAGGAARCALRTDSHVAQIAAIEAGVGIGVCYLEFARTRPALVRVLPQLAASLECWVWSPRSQLRGAAGGQVIDSLVAILSDQMGAASRARMTRPAPAALDNIAA